VKGIVLAGGTGSRLHPMTAVTSKQLLPIYDKPMIFYPLSTLMLAGIRDILIISTPVDLPKYKELLHDGSRFGIHLSYAEQAQPNGLAEAFIIGESFIKEEASVLILGDNIFYGSGLVDILMSAVHTIGNVGGGNVFAYHVSDPSRYGVVEFDADGHVTSIEEKPNIPQSSYAITGLYFYDNQVCKFARELEPSARGELEITCINERYLESGQLNVSVLGRGFTWLDAGTFESLYDASNFVRSVERLQNIIVSCLEEIAFLRGWISNDQLLSAAKHYGNSPYGGHLRRIAENQVLSTKKTAN
jgi:glucose-1-phosphate thymidylyltransferase